MAKDKVVNVRMSEPLYNMLQLKAEASGVKPSELLRQSVQRVNIKFDDSRDIGMLIGTLNRIGNNLNQIAKVLNTANKYDNLNDVDYKLISDELYIIRQSFRELIQC